MDDDIQKEVLKTKKNIERSKTKAYKIKTFLLSFDLIFVNFLPFCFILPLKIFFGFHHIFGLKNHFDLFLVNLELFAKIWPYNYYIII